MGLLHAIKGVAESGLAALFFVADPDCGRGFRGDRVNECQRSREVGGTGLGLSIVKHVAERMNGTVRVESSLGRGATFTILLPALNE